RPTPRSSLRAAEEIPHGCWKVAEGDAVMGGQGIGDDAKPLGTEDSTTGSRLLTEGVLLALASLAGYAIAFAHEAGYATYFGVPLDLVSIDITRILVVLAVLVGLALILLTMSNTFFLSISERLPQPMRGRLALIFLPTVLLVAT